MRIKATDRDRLAAELNAIQGRATAAILTPDDVARLAARAEKACEAAGLPKACRKGAQYQYLPAGPSANAYKWRRDTTGAVLERGAGAWYLVGLTRYGQPPKAAGIDRLCLTAAQREGAARRFLAQFGEVRA